MSSERRCFHWFDYACRIKRAGRDASQAIAEKHGKRITRQEFCTFEKLAAVHPRIGKLMQDLNAPKRVFVRVAHGRGATAHRERAKLELAALLDKRASLGDHTAAHRRLLEAVLLSL